MTFHDHLNGDVRDTLHAAAETLHADDAVVRRLLANAQAGRSVIVRLDRRRRWIAPLLAAMVVMAVAIGSAVAMSATGNHRSPATRSTPPAPVSTAVVPPVVSSRTPSLTPTMQPTTRATSSPPTTPHYSTQHIPRPPSSGPAPRTQSTPPNDSVPQLTGATTVKEFQGVQLTVPAGWTMYSQPIHSASGVCLSPSHSRTECVLSVMVPLKVDEGHVFRPNANGGEDQGGSFCGSAGARTVTVAADQVTIDGHTALYKRYSAPCGPVAREQWVVPTRPGVIFLHDLTGTPTDGVVETVVRNAVLPGPRTSYWLGDTAIINSVSVTRHHVQLGVHRIVPLEQGNYLLGDIASDAVPTDVVISVQISDTRTTGITLVQLRRWASRDNRPAGAGPLSSYAAEITRAYGARVSLNLRPLPGHPTKLPAT